jgi:hypothetical protein
MEINNQKLINRHLRGAVSCESCCDLLAVFSPDCAAYRSLGVVCHNWLKWPLEDAIGRTLSRR